MGSVPPFRLRGRTEVGGRTEVCRWTRAAEPGGRLAPALPQAAGLEGSDPLTPRPGAAGRRPGSPSAPASRRAGERAAPRIFSPRPQHNGRQRGAPPTQGARPRAGSPGDWPGGLRGARGRGRGAGTCAKAVRPARGARAPCLNERGLAAPATTAGFAPRPKADRPAQVRSLASALPGCEAVDGTERRGAGGGARRGAGAARERVRRLGHGGPQDLSPTPRAATWWRAMGTERGCRRAEP